MPPNPMSRRRWLELLAACGPAILQAQEHAHTSVQPDAPAVLSVLSPADAAEIEAMAAQIIPSDETPGAREAGVIYFIDRALQTFDAARRPLYTSGLADAQAKRAALFPGSRSIAQLSSAQQIQLLHAIEDSEFFEQLRVHCIMAFLGNPSYGGNRGRLGWKLIGFDDQFHFQPPFGYYDDPAHIKERP